MHREVADERVLACRRATHSQIMLRMSSASCGPAPCAMTDSRTLPHTDAGLHVNRDIFHNCIANQAQRCRNVRSAARAKDPLALEQHLAPETCQLQGAHAHTRHSYQTKTVRFESSNALILQASRLMRASTLEGWMFWVSLVPEFAGITVESACHSQLC